MPSHRRLPLTPMMLAIAMPWVVSQADLRAADEQPPVEQPGPRLDAMAAQAAYAEAYALYRKANFAEAKDKVDEVIDCSTIAPSVAETQCKMTWPS